MVSSLRLSMYLILIICLISIECKSKKKLSKRAKKVEKGSTKVIPKKHYFKVKRSKGTKHLLSKFQPKLNLLHKESRYDKMFLDQYKKMIDSLLPDAEMFTNFNSDDFLPLPSDIKTVKSIYSDETVKLPKCSKSKEKNWKKIKVLQVEDNNSVTLKQNSLTGAKVVEKKMIGGKHYEKEMNFFSHAHHGSSKYYPSFICSAASHSRKGHFSIITDFVDGNQSHVMAAVASADQLRFMVGQLFNAIIELHKVGFIHCDLTPANVIVSNEFEVKLIDFGMALPVGQAYGYRGSFYTRAPELQRLCPGKIDVAIDWWAFGCTVAIWYYYNYNPKMLEDKTSTYAFSPMKLISRKRSRYNAGQFPSQFPVALRKLLRLFLTFDPEYRSFSTVRLQEMVRNHEYFNEFDWSLAAMD